MQAGRTVVSVPGEYYPYDVLPKCGGRGTKQDVDAGPVSDVFLIDAGSHHAARDREVPVGGSDVHLPVLKTHSRVDFDHSEARSEGEHGAKKTHGIAAPMDDNEHACCEVTGQLGEDEPDGIYASRRRTNRNHVTSHLAEHDLRAPLGNPTRRLLFPAALVMLTWDTASPRNCHRSST